MSTFLFEGLAISEISTVGCNKEANPDIKNYVILTKVQVIGGK
jgi:hypothetical protein